MNIDIGLGTLLMFGMLLLLLGVGLPVTFAIGGVGSGFAFLIMGPKIFASIFSTVFVWFSMEIIIACPMFILMAMALQYSGIGDAAYGMAYKWMGGLRGGLAMGTIIICTIFAAMAGTSGAATFTMGLVAIPSMVNRGYSKRLAAGCVATGGVLGMVIPPSALMILYGAVTKLSVGKLFFGGVFAGLVCSALYITYVGIRCWFKPSDGPPLPLEQRASWKQKAVSLKAVALPLILISVVLGSIYLGVATPVESSAIGAFGAFLCAAVNGKLNLSLVKRASLGALQITTMVYWVVGVAVVFSNVYTWMGAKEWVQTMLNTLQLNPMAVVIVMMASMLILGCLMDDLAVTMLCAPLYHPIIVMLGMNPLWFGILFILNIQIAWLTPPYGFNLLYLRGLSPYIKEQTGQDLTLGDLYRSVLPFIPLQILGLVLVMVFPQIALWLPNQMVKIS